MTSNHRPKCEAGLSTFDLLPMDVVKKARTTRTHEWVIEHLYVIIRVSNSPLTSSLSHGGRGIEMGLSDRNSIEGLRLFPLNVLVVQSVSAERQVH